ncbi:beta-lactamase/transpeptidase-like protein [Tanacetum coccineum]
MLSQEFQKKIELYYHDFDQYLKSIVVVAPETEPGHEQLYHYLSYGWLCGGIIEHASGKKFSDILEKAFPRFSTSLLTGPNI